MVGGWQGREIKNKANISQTELLAELELGLSLATTEELNKEYYFIQYARNSTFLLCTLNITILANLSNSMIT